jgi:DNA-binding NarL/FixJ family response regulator
MKTTPNATSKAASILIADDHAVVRRGLRALLETQRGWRICGEASDGKQAVEKAALYQPDVVILDISMPELSGAAAMLRIREVAPKARVLVLTMHNSEELVHSCLQAGAQGYILKSDAERDLVYALQAVLDGKTFFTHDAADLVAKLGERDGQTTEQVFEHLSRREQEVIQLLAQGMSNKEVGAALGISIRTVESHRANIMSKLHLESLGELVRYAIRNKMIEP